MRWPWQRRRPALDTGEARAARRDAEDKLARTCDQQEAISDVVNQLRELRRRNRFADMIAESMRPRREDRP